MSRSKFNIEPRLGLSVLANLALAGLAWKVHRDNRQTERLFEWSQQLLEQSERNGELEPKTGLLNYPSFKKRVHQQTHSRRSIDQGKVNGLVLGDIDDFKGWNNRLSYHDVDRRALIPAAEVIKRSIRPEDAAARFGGDEFVIFLSNTGIQGTAAAAEKIHTALNGIYPMEDSSAGLESSMAYTLLAHGEDYDQAFELLDTALKAAKQGGKNQIVNATTFTA